MKRPNLYFSMGNRNLWNYFVPTKCSIHSFNQSIRTNPLNQTYELKDAAQILNHPEFILNRPTVLYIHGFIETPMSPTVQKITAAYTKRGTHNILILDWSTLADGLYPTAVRKSSEVSFQLLHLVVCKVQRTIYPHPMTKAIKGKLWDISARASNWCNFRGIIWQRFASPESSHSGTQSWRSFGRTNCSDDNWKIWWSHQIAEVFLTQIIYRNPWSY